MDLPFTRFRFSIPPQLVNGHGSVCRIIKVLDEVVIDGIPQPLLLVHIRYESRNEVMDYFWTAAFDYEEGIGGRTILNVHHIKLIQFLGISDIDEVKAAANSKEIINIRGGFHATCIEVIE